MYVRLWIVFVKVDDWKLVHIRYTPTVFCCMQIVCNRIFAFEHCAHTNRMPIWEANCTRNEIEIEGAHTRVKKKWGRYGWKQCGCQLCVCISVKEIRLFDAFFPLKMLDSSLFTLPFRIRVRCLFFSNSFFFAIGSVLALPFCVCCSRKRGKQYPRNTMHIEHECTMSWKRFTFQWFILSQNIVAHIQSEWESESRTNKPIIHFLIKANAIEFPLSGFLRYEIKLNEMRAEIKDKRMNRGKKGGKCIVNLRRSWCT